MAKQQTTNASPVVEEAVVDVLKQATAETQKVEKAIQAEKEPTDIEELLLSEIQIDPSKKYTFELLKTGVTKYVYPTSQIIFDPIQKRQREIKYLRTSQAVFKEHQNDVVEDTYTPIVFECPRHLIKKGARAKLEVSGTDRNLIVYLLLTQDVEGSKTRVGNKGAALFRLIDHAKIAKQKLGSMELRYRAINLAMELPIERLRPIAYVLNVSHPDDGDMKVALYSKIEENPQAFLQLADDPTTARKYLIKKALENAVISSTLHPNQLFWVETNAKITNIDPSQDAVEYITAWTFTQEGEEFFNLLRRKIS